MTGSPDSASSSLQLAYQVVELQQQIRIKDGILETQRAR